MFSSPAHCAKFVKDVQDRLSSGSQAANVDKLLVACSAILRRYEDGFRSEFDVDTQQTMAAAQKLRAECLARPLAIYKLVNDLVNNLEPSGHEKHIDLGEKLNFEFARNLQSINWGTKLSLQRICPHRATLDYSLKFLDIICSCFKMNINPCVPIFYNRYLI
jgi:hypothetical protein